MKIARITAAIFILAFVFHYGNFFLARIDSIFFRPAACQTAVSYTLGELDERFNINRDELLAASAYAGAMWENAAGKTLFILSDSAELSINLVYDYRQEASDQLKKLNVNIKNDKASYDFLTKEYRAAVDIYNRWQSEFEQENKIFEAAKNEYEKSVAGLRKRGRASSDQYEKLEADRLALNKQVDELNRKKDRLNEQAAKINALAAAINNLIKALNLTVEEYNAIGAKTGKEFAAGEYIADRGGRRINIYQFADLERLKQILAHEFGHALGLEHSLEPESVMYYLNEAGGGSLTAGDTAAVKTLCNLP